MKLLLIDLSHIFWTTWFATAGQQYNTAFTVTIERVDRLKDGYDAVAACCDIGPSWRKELFPGYKAGRPERDPAAYEQLRLVRKRLEEEGVPVLAVERYEADDIIATLACKAAGQGYETTIASGDKDLLQLVGGPIRVLSTNPNGTLMGPEEVSEKFGVTPAQLGDFLALCGDKSDNVPGAPGIGSVTAARLLKELGSLANMLEVPDGITPPRIREIIIANREQVLLSKRLVTLTYNVPIDFAESIKPRPRKLASDSKPAVEAPGDDTLDDDEELPTTASDARPATGGGTLMAATVGAGGGGGAATLTGPESFWECPDCHIDVRREASGPGSHKCAKVEPSDANSSQAQAGGVGGHEMLLQSEGEAWTGKNSWAPKLEAAEPTIEQVQAKPSVKEEAAKLGVEVGAIHTVSQAIILDRQDPRWLLALEPRGLRQLEWFANKLYDSQLYKKFPNPESIMAVILRGRALGLDMTTALDVFNVVEGKPTMGAMAIIGLILASGKAEYFRPIEIDSNVRAVWETKRVGDPKVSLPYTIEDAQLAGLDKPHRSGALSNWVKRPKPMLRKQAALELGRAVYPDVVANVYAPHEFGGDEDE